MQRSAVPPPLTSNPFWWGDQAKAFTAALWLKNRHVGSEPVWLAADHTRSLLSLPPDASWVSSGLHLRPQTSYLWPRSWAMLSSRHRKSWLWIARSFEPELRMLVLHERAPTLPIWPSYFRTSFCCSMSQTYTIPLSVPTERCVPLLSQLTAVTSSELSNSCSLVTFADVALQM